MEQKKYKLTISVLASNRKDTLPKTLQSIKPILDNVSSELIVTDTGCDEELLAVIREYTDKIVKFEWCKDFSKARNVSVKMAQGQWYMFVDDDEWFEDVTSIIDFFNSGECDKYNAFDYVQRNYNNYESTEWVDTLVGRGTRLVEGQCFVDVIHEHFYHNMRPIKMFDAYVHHYGYIYKSVEDKEKHSRRNLELLENQLANGTTNLRQYVHMLQEYNGLGMDEKALAIGNQALEMVVNSNLYIRRYVSGIKVNIVYSLMNMKKDTEALRIATEYIKAGGINQSSYCALYGYLSYIYYRIGDVRGAAEAAKEYANLYMYLKRNEVQIIQESVLAIGNLLCDTAADEIMKIQVLCMKQLEMCEIN